MAGKLGNSTWDSQRTRLRQAFVSIQAENVKARCLRKSVRCAYKPNPAGSPCKKSAWAGVMKATGTAKRKESGQSIPVGRLPAKNGTKFSRGLCAANSALQLQCDLLFRAT